MSAADLIRQHPNATPQQLEARYGISQSTVQTTRWRDANSEHRRRWEQARRRSRGILPQNEYNRRRSMAAWPAKSVTILKRNWGHIYAAQIADLIGKTRNAVIGKAHRLGLPRLK